MTGEQAAWEVVDRTGIESYAAELSQPVVWTATIVTFDAAGSGSPSPTPTLTPTPSPTGTPTPSASPTPTPTPTPTTNPDAHPNDATPSVDSADDDT